MGTEEFIKQSIRLGMFCALAVIARAAAAQRVLLNMSNDLVILRLVEASRINERLQGAMKERLGLLNLERTGKGIGKANGGFCA